MILAYIDIILAKLEMERYDKLEGQKRYDSD